jgi:hypothetical protein
MNQETTGENLNAYEPWVVVDISKREWLLPEPLRYYVCHDSNNGTWYVCDRSQDNPVAGTHAQTRPNTIRQFYKLFNREIPVGVEVPKAQAGVSHQGERL